MSDPEDQQLDHGNERGATMLEYGLLISLVAAVVAIAVTLLGGAVALLFTEALNVLSP